MTVSTTLNKIIYPGNGAQTAFPFTFAFPGGTATQEAANIQVFFTDTLGNITQLAQGSGATQYQITFNPATGTNPTPSGGTVTYNPNSIPIPLGTSLTILRSLPLTQSTSLANQGTLYQPVEEAALDYGIMIAQQVLEVQSRALVVPVSDAAPGALPAKAARANLFLAFDSNGNPIASQPSGANTPISSAMAPVVTAATLAAGRTAFGLGTMAVENIGAGLADDGSGNARLFFNPIFDSTAQTVTSSFAFNRRILSGNVTYTLPLSTGLFNGFGFWIDTTGFTATFAVNAADSFSGMSTGASLVVGPGQTIFVNTNASGLWFVDKGRPVDLNAVANLQINASVAGSALTVAIKDRNGNDPSTSSPIVIGFRDPTVANGDPVARAISGPLSVTVPNGASLGTVNGQASRIWVGLFDNAGSPVLGVFNSVGGTTILSWDESLIQTTTAISAGSTNAQQWYTSVGVASRALRVLGYVESTQPTAGAWTASPSKVQLFGPGIKRPGDVVSESYFGLGTGTTTSATFAVLTSISAFVLSAANVIRLDAVGSYTNSSAGNVANSVRLSRGAVNNTNMIGNQSAANTSGTGASAGFSCIAFDQPNTSGAQTYALQGDTNSGTLTLTSGASLVIKEIQV